MSLAMEALTELLVLEGTGDAPVAEHEIVEHLLAQNVARLFVQVTATKHPSDRSWTHSLDVQRVHWYTLKQLCLISSLLLLLLLLLLVTEFHGIRVLVIIIFWSTTVFAPHSSIV